ncbi:hypothetical protein LWE61_11835 [Sphingobium sufflavum]|uniref:hypothetical protein n=1 Tax=Sphingobium sufflavum TaxID=1129547 RepID=UPI001F39A5ED|nr:hypothetical protein [Sphingobium sufflavum]MCE7797248.1 hypothetical protein [Sphingobium sufflavum]
MMDYRPIKPASGPHPNAHLARDSNLIEKALEFQLVGQIMARLLLRGHRSEVLHSVCDRDGYDIVIEAKGIVRHIQLKAIVQGGKRANVSLPVGLGRKRSGCAVVMGWDQNVIQPVGFHFFGGLPGQPLPDLGAKITNHTRGKKKPRSEHGNIGLGKFIRQADSIC